MPDGGSDAFFRVFMREAGSGFGDGEPPDTWGSQRRGVPGLTVILILILILILSLATTYDSIRACNQRGRMGWNPEYLSSFLRWSGLGRFSADDAFFGIRGTVRVERVGPGVDAAVTASLREVGDRAGSGSATTLLSQRLYGLSVMVRVPGGVDAAVAASLREVGDRAGSGPGVDAAVTASLRLIGDRAGSGLASTLLSQRRYASLACAVPPGWVLNCSMIW